MRLELNRAILYEAILNVTENKTAFSPRDVIDMLGYSNEIPSSWYPPYRIMHIRSDLAILEREGLIRLRDDNRYVVVDREGLDPMDVDETFGEDAEGEDIYVRLAF